MEEDQRDSIMKMQEEYLDYKNSFGELIPNHFVYNKLRRFGEWVLLAHLIISVGVFYSIFTGWATIKQDLLIVQIYPDTTSFDRIDRDTKNSLETQLALVGGTMGLLTGGGHLTDILYSIENVIILLFLY